jgi:hypothetical protein
MKGEELVGLYTQVKRQGPSSILAVMYRTSQCQYQDAHNPNSHHEDSKTYQVQTLSAIKSVMFLVMNEGDPLPQSYLLCGCT